MKEQFVLDDRPIQKIGWWFEPEFNSIEVGEEGITKINCAEQYCGEYSIYWLQIWRNDRVVARYNARNIDCIFYEE